MTLAPSDLGPEFRDMVTTQQYDPAPRIDGIRLIDLRLMSDDGGSFAELVRLDEEGNLEGVPGFKVRQSSYSLMLPGAIKAFHLHYNQEDVWFVPPTDRILVGLIDARKDSPSYNVRMRIAMGGGKTQLLYIPRGVAHGAANLTAQPAVIFYYVNQHFSLADPDERRLPWDAGGKDFWEMTRG
ncbi:MAG: dTDP-4-dehydrorhamnose 3,5-epimerase family protein [Capsulimonas sp.]|uniref:dTDP-4-dehydrorhamnose 3,5-epimerase family protein n=1 Tax=Capsulimonas sp. TaxID=2494211 RepID=UPI00326573A0